MDRILRGLQRDRLIRSDGRSRIIRGGKGSTGYPAGQDIMFGPLTGFFADGEQIKGGRLAHPATFNIMLVETDSSVEATQTFTIQQVRDGTVIASATFTLNPGDHYIQAAIGPPLDFAVGDYPRLVAPSPADVALHDLTVTLGSTPS